MTDTTPDTISIFPNAPALREQLRVVWMDPRSVAFRENIDPAFRAWLEAGDPLPDFPDAAQDVFEVQVRVLVRNVGDVEGIIEQRLSGPGAVLDFNIDEPKRVRVLRPYRRHDHFDSSLPQASVGDNSDAS